MDIFDLHSFFHVREIVKIHPRFPAVSINPAFR
jgi:hypothetical protein